MVNSRDDVVITDRRPGSVRAQERHSLLESARLCEMIVEANPADTGALETLKETYTKLGDRDKLMRVVSALAVLSGVRASVGVAASKADEVDDVPAAGPARSPGPPPDRRMARLGDRLIAEGLITREQLAQALAVQKGTRDKVGTMLVRLGLLTEERLLSCLSQQHNVPSITWARSSSTRRCCGSFPERSPRSSKCCRSSAPATR